MNVQQTLILELLHSSPDLKHNKAMADQTDTIDKQTEGEKTLETFCYSALL